MTWVTAKKSPAHMRAVMQRLKDSLEAQKESTEEAVEEEREPQQTSQHSDEKVEGRPTQATSSTEKLHKKPKHQASAKSGDLGAKAAKAVGEKKRKNSDDGAKKAEKRHKHTAGKSTQQANISLNHVTNPTKTDSEEKKRKHETDGAGKSEKAPPKRQRRKAFCEEIGFNVRIKPERIYGVVDKVIPELVKNHKAGMDEIPLGELSLKVGYKNPQSDPIADAIKLLKLRGKIEVTPSKTVKLTQKGISEYVGDA